MTSIMRDVTSVVNVRLRPKSTEPPITATTFYKFQLPVPAELRDFCVDEKVIGIMSGLD